MHYYIDFLYDDSITYKASTESGDAFHFLISEIDYKKELYAPCHLRVEMNLKKNVIGPAQSDGIVTKLLSSTVTVKLSDDDKKVVGMDYIVYDCRHKINYETNGGLTHRFSLEIYSRDKLLDIHKFSHVYLNKKLGEHIIGRTLAEKSATEEGKKDTSHKGVPDLSKLKVKFNNEFITNLQHTKFEIDAKKYELIHPYRVQYNETFYSFISRLANRCGEFLFFEDDQLHLGIILPKKDEVTPTLETANLSSIEYIQKNTEKSDNLQVNAFYQNYFSDEITDNANVPSLENLYYNDDFSYDEFLEVISEDDDDFKDSVGKEFSWAGLLDFIMSNFPSGLLISKDNNTETPYYAEYFINLGLRVGVYVADLVSKSAGANKIRRDYFFENLDDKESDGFVEDYCENLQYTDKGNNDKKERSQFGVLKRLAKEANNLMAEFYDNIRKKEIESSHNIVRLHLKDFSNKPIKLGQYIEVGGTEIKGYVVGIYCSYIPIDSSIKEEVTVDVCQFIEGKIYPVYHKCREINRISAQSAIVADANDPLALGRVRIRYPWQDASESGSPWIRMVVPLASKDHGRVFFMPNKDDEVMVDYINGNPEKPYVAGSLFHGKKSFSESLRWPETSVIRSYNGQKLAFTGECVSDFFSSLIGDPAITSNFHLVGDALGWDWLDAADQGALEFMHGRMTLTDKFGFWSISGDTGKRSISIESKFGDVSIDAFTGITISAPNGDINIEGKNINITASNNINIEAGQAIKKSLDTYAWSAIVKDIVGATIGSVDLSLIRCIWDAINPPVDGMLKIKSYRNVFIEANKDGGTWINDNDNNTDRISQIREHYTYSEISCLNQWTKWEFVKSMINVIKIKFDSTWNVLKEISDNYRAIADEYFGRPDSPFPAVCLGYTFNKEISYEAVMWRGYTGLLPDSVNTNLVSQNENKNEVNAIVTAVRDKHDPRYKAKSLRRIISHSKHLFDAINTIFADINAEQDPPLVKDCYAKVIKATLKKMHLEFTAKNEISSIANVSRDDIEWKEAKQQAYVYLVGYLFDKTKIGFKFTTPMDDDFTNRTNDVINSLCRSSSSFDGAIDMVEKLGFMKDDDIKFFSGATTRRDSGTSRNGGGIRMSVWKNRLVELTEGGNFSVKVPQQGLEDNNNNNNNIISLFRDAITTLIFNERQ